MKLLVLLLCAATAQAAIVDVYSGLPGNAGTGGSPLDFSGDTLAGSFFSADINFGSGSTNWDPLGLTSNYGADIHATIQVSAAGNYTFNTSSDDGSLLFIDGQLVVNNNFNQGVTERQGSINLSAGTHALEIQYFQGGGGNALISTLPAGVSYVYEVPTLEMDIYQDPSSLTCCSPSAGLIPAGATLVGNIPTDTVNFGLPNSDWMPFGLTQQFSAEMKGYFDVATSGSYTFNTGSDDGSYLFIDGQLVVNNAFYQGYTVRQGTVSLSAGQHLFDLQYFQGGGGAALTMGVPAGVTMAPLPEPATGTALAIVFCLAALVRVLWRRRFDRRGIASAQEPKNAEQIARVTW